MSTLGRLEKGSDRPEPYATFKDSTAGNRLFMMCRGRPKMFGNPGDLEAQCLSNAHIVLASRLPNWRFDDTTALWREVARERLGADRFRGEVELHARFHRWRWDDREDEAWDQVASVFRRLWAGMAPELRDPNQAPDPEHAFVLVWTEHVLGRPRLFDNPAEYEYVLEDLLWRAHDEDHISDAARERYDEAYQREFRRAGRDELRRFHDVGTEEELDRRRGGVRPYPQFSSYDQVTDGVTAVVWRMRALVTA